jgi:hypothetical protein
VDCRGARSSRHFHRGCRGCPPGSAPAKALSNVVTPLSSVGSMTPNWPSVCLLTQGPMLRGWRAIGPTRSKPSSVGVPRRNDPPGRSRAALMSGGVSPGKSRGRSSGGGWWLNAEGRQSRTYRELSLAGAWEDGSVPMGGFGGLTTVPFGDSGALTTVPMAGFGGLTTVPLGVSGGLTTVPMKHSVRCRIEWPALR